MRILLISISVILFAFFKPISMNFYENNFNIKTIDGEPLNFEKFKGKKLLLVNVASKCGLTPQYKELQELYDKYNGKLEIVGFPCNQFLNQEPGTAEEIKTFCTKNYGVTFTITEKIDVKGKNQHPIYQWLTDKEKNGVESSKVKWNFQKYLIDENGNYIAHFDPTVKPMSEEILKYLE
jgi:glutathione peroxidase